MVRETILRQHICSCGSIGNEGQARRCADAVVTRRGSVAGPPKFTDNRFLSQHHGVRRIDVASASA